MGSDPIFSVFTLCPIPVRDLSAGGEPGVLPGADAASPSIRAFPAQDMWPGVQGPQGLTGPQGPKGDPGPQ